MNGNQNIFAVLIVLIIFSCGCINNAKVNQSAAEEKSYTFFVTSDAHFGAKSVTDEKLNKLLAAIDRVKPDFIVIAGDVMSADEFGWDNCSNKYTDFRKKNAIPVFELPGNHDAVNRYLKEWINTTGKPLYYGFDWSGIHFIALADENEDLIGTISKEQLAWLRDEIIEHSNKTIIVFSHYPLPNTVVESYNPEKKIGITEKSDEILNILNTTGSVKIWFSGHYHLDHSYEPSMKNTLGVAHINLAPILDSRGMDTFEIRIVEVRKNNIEVKTYDVENGSYIQGASHLIETETSFNGIGVRGQITGGFYSRGNDSDYQYRPFEIIHYSFENVVNGSVADGWELHKTGDDESIWEFASSNPKHGKYAIKIIKYNSEDNSNIRTQKGIYPEVTAGRLYVLSAWTRSEVEIRNCVGLSIGWIDENGSAIDWTNLRTKSKNGWDKINLFAVAPTGAVKAELRCKVYEKNVVYWDDVDFEYFDYVKD